MRITFILLFCLALLGSLTAQQARANTDNNGKVTVVTAVDGKLKTASIKTSAQCGMCKKTIEAALAGAKGVESANLDVTTKRLKVKYDPAKTNLDAIRKMVAAVGYDADDVAADGKAYAALPACCQKGGHD